MESNYPLIWDSKNHPKISPMIAYKICNLSSQQNASKRDINNIEGGTNGSTYRRSGQDAKSQLFHTSSPQRNIALARKRQEVIFDPKNVRKFQLLIIEIFREIFTYGGRSVQTLNQIYCIH